jgi:hypothetical protein
MTAAVAILLTNKRCISAIYEPISIVISTQTQTHMPISIFMKVELSEVIHVTTIAAMFQTGFFTAIAAIVSSLHLNWYGVLKTFTAYVDN